MATKNISVTQAVDMAKKLGIKISRVSIIKYIKEKNLGYQLHGEGSPWIVNREKFRRFLNGKDQQNNKKPNQANKEEIKEQTVGSCKEHQTPANSINVNESGMHGRI